MNLPSVRTIETRLRLDRGTAKAIRREMETLRSMGNLGVVYTMRRIDKLMGTCGVEYLRGGVDDFGNKGVEYCNSGDTYADTVLFDVAEGRFIIGSWGDLVMRNPKRFE